MSISHFSCYAATAQNGMEFFVGFLKNYDRQRTVVDFNQLLITSLSSTPVEFTVRTLLDGELHKGTVSSRSPATVDVPMKYIVLNGSPTQRRKGIQISTNGSDISVVAANAKKVNEDGATTATYSIVPHQHLPVQEYEYFALSISSSSRSHMSEILLVGTEDNTTVTVFPSQTVSLPRDPQDGENSEDTIMVQPGQGHTMTLHRLQTLLITKADKLDLTGTRIVSNKPLSVLSGHECGNIPIDVGNCDHVGVHVPPTATWGKEFFLVPFLGRTAGQWFKMVSAQNDTVVQRTCSGNAPKIVNLTTTGSVYEFHTNSYTLCYLQSNKPLIVAEMSQGLQTDGMGDPAMMIIPPVERYANKISFLPLTMTESFNFADNFITIITTPEHFNPNNILLDDQPIAADWSMVLNQAKDTIAYGCKLPVSPGPHIVQHRHPNGRLSVLVYGFDSQPRHGYGFEAGVGMMTDYAGKYIHSYLKF